MVVEIQRHALPVAVENVGVNGYVSEHGNRQPNVTNLQEFARVRFGKSFFGGREGCSFGSQQKVNEKKIKIKVCREILNNEKLIKIKLQKESRLMKVGGNQPSTEKIRRFAFDD